MAPPVDLLIFKKFKSGIFYEDIYKENDVNQDDLIKSLQKNIKGNYDYMRILTSGLSGQKQFLKHLSNRWNPLEPDASWKEISPYYEPQFRKMDDNNQ